MTTTLATKKQSQAIRQKMAEIRTELPYSADAARHDVRRLADWKYHMSKRPLPFLAAATLIGFLIVPKRGSLRGESAASRRHNRVDHSAKTVTTDANLSKPVAKSGLIGGLLGTATTIAFQQVAVIVAKQAETWLNKGENS